MTGEVSRGRACSAPCWAATICCSRWALSQPKQDGRVRAKKRSGSSNQAQTLPTLSVEWHPGPFRIIMNGFGKLWTAKKRGTGAWCTKWGAATPPRGGEVGARPMRALEPLPASEPDGEILQFGFPAGKALLGAPDQFRTLTELVLVWFQPGIIQQFGKVGTSHCFLQNMRCPLLRLVLSSMTDWR